MALIVTSVRDKVAALKRKNHGLGGAVHPAEVPVTAMFKCMAKWGTGAGDLLAALPWETSPKTAGRVK